MSTTYVGWQVQASSGTWNNSPTAFTYQWSSSPDNVTWTPIAGATRSDYITTADDLGHWLRCGVTATNAVGSSSVTYSDWIGPVGEYVPPPDPNSPTVLRAVTVLSGSTPAPPFPTLYARKKHHH